jgi:tripartite-type tricarboxylate transporter receptor subunit TctC
MVLSGLGPPLLGGPKYPTSRLSARWDGQRTPKDIIGKLNAAAVEALADRAVRSRVAALGLEIFPRERQTPETLGAMVKADAEKWWPIIKELRIKVE